MSFSMDRQISYNGPLAASLSPVPKSYGTGPFLRSPLPCNFSSSLPSSLMNHPLPPKTPTAKYFLHTNTPPARNLGIQLHDTTAPHVDRCKCLPMNTEPKFSSSDHGASASPIGTLGRCYRTEDLPPFDPSVEPRPTLSGRGGAQRVAKNTMRSTSKSTRLKRYSRIKPASAALESAGITAASGPRTRARATAETSCSFSTSRKVRPYSEVEDGLLQKLVGRGLPWEQVAKEFGRTFAERNPRSLQARWSRHLKFTARSARISLRGISDGEGQRHNYP